MRLKRRTSNEYPSVAWFRERTASYQALWDSTPWHENGERALKSVKESIRKYAPVIKELPDSFLPSVLDQHLAVLSEGYEYRILDIVEALGDDRYLCADETGETYCLWSRSATLNAEHGGMTQLTAIIRLETDSGGPIPAITYGPVLSWKSLRAVDFSMVGRAVARDLMRLKGLTAVIERDPAPFWAAWSLGDVPPVLHGTRLVCTCWHEGRFGSDPGPLLTRSWKRDAIGNRIRYRKPGSKPFFEQVVVYDAKTSRGLLLARRDTYLERLSESLGMVFTSDSSEPCIASTTLEMAFSGILRKSLPYGAWTSPFDRLDDRRSEKARIDHPERESELDALNEALGELLPYINERRPLDWDSFAAEHGYGAEMIETLRGFYKKYAR